MNIIYRRKTETEELVVAVLMFMGSLPLIMSMNPMQKPEENTGFPETGFTSGNQTTVLRKNNQCS